MHILFAGGGTAGHINPALAVAGYIKERHPDAKISYIGTAEKLEEGTGWQSPKYKINGLTTHMDSVSFIFTNYLNSDLVRHRKHLSS